MRAKWSAPIRKYWKISEQMMVKYCDLAICDSVNIEKYIHESCLTKKAYGTQPGHTQFYYPKKYGYGELWLRMADSIKGQIEYIIRFGIRVTAMGSPATVFPSWIPL